MAKLLQRRWTAQILLHMSSGPVRLSKLRRQIPGASKKGLSATLLLVSSGFVVRHDLSGTVLHVEYEFAASMRDDIVRLLSSLSILGGRIEVHPSKDALKETPSEGALTGARCDPQRAEAPYQKPTTCPSMTE
jgi:DNA-binding HxlR family transcriptional regulator